LPNYNSDNVQRVIDALSSKDGEGIPSNIKKKPVGNSDEQELHVAEDKKEVFEWLNALQLKTYVFNRFKVNNYLTSLFNLAYLAANTQGCDPNAAVRVSKQICKMIFDYIADLKADGTYNNKVHDIKQFILTESKMEYLTENKLKDTSNLVLELTDYDIEREFARADSKLKNVGQRYIRDNYDEEDPMKSKVEVILFVQSEECMANLDKYAKDTFYQYQRDYRKYLSKFSENVKSKYDKYTREGESVSGHSWILPRTIYLPKDEEQWEDRKHLFIDNEGKALFTLNSWEKEVIIEAEKKPDFVCWLRNQDRKPWSLCIPYTMNEKKHPFYPDFIIIRKDAHGGYLLDIVEPHKKDEDNVPKAKAMAKYAEEADGDVERFEMTRMYGDKMLRLDFANPAISHLLTDANKYDDDYLDELFKKIQLSNK
jgi:type III restriction enzyme